MKNIYIFSNVSSNKKINVFKEDILIFLNDAVPFKNYKDVNCKKYLFRRYLISKNTYAGQDLQNINTYYIRGQLDNFPISYKQLITKYDFNYSFYGQKQPTTGWLVYNLCKKIFPYDNINLVNFFPNADFSTYHDPCHNWKFENQFYKNNNVNIIDTRN